MNELLQKHGCANVFTVPDGLKELMSDISREVLRWQPPQMFDFIAKYLSALLITREHGIMAVKILNDLCDCRPSVSEHLLQIGLARNEVDILAEIIKNEIEGSEPAAGKEKVKETAILKKILAKIPLDEEMSAKVCQVARNAYRDYWYRKTTMKKGLKMKPEEPWEMAAQHTLELYKKTKPSITELQRATEKIQAAYRGYHVRRNVLRHLQPQPKKKNPCRKVEIPGPPLDIAASREIDLGPIINIRIQEDDIDKMFDDETGEKLGLQYDPMKTITNKEDGNIAGAQLQKGGKIQKQQFTVMKATMDTTSPMAVVSRHSQMELLMSETKQFKTYNSPTPERVKEEPHTQRISFAEAPPEVITDSMDDYEPEVPEMLGTSIEVEEVMPPGAFEIPEELGPDGDDLDYSTQLSSGAQSAHTTDIEDAASVDEELL